MQFIKYVLQSLFLVWILTSCSNKIEKGESEQQQFALSIDLTGEITDLVESKAGGDDIIALQVYQKGMEVGDKYKPYCYGLWDNNLVGAVLKINKGFAYRFEATLVQNAKNIIATSIEGAMKQPFTVSGTGGDSRLNNSFIYSSTNYFSGLYQGTSAVINNKTYNLFARPLINRYYANVIDVFIEEDTRINLEMKRVVFGLKYNIKGFTEGSVLIELKNSPTIELKKDSYATAQSIVCFQGSSFEIGEWLRDDYSELIEYTVRWKKDDGTLIKIMTNQHDFQRKMLYTMDIDLTQTDSKGSIDISKDDDKLGDGGII